MNKPNKKCIAYYLLFTFFVLDNIISCYTFFLIFEWIELLSNLKVRKLSLFLHWFFYDILILKRDMSIFIL